jgi:hypothetical protein
MNSVNVSLIESQVGLFVPGEDRPSSPVLLSCFFEVESYNSSREFRPLEKILEVVLCPDKECASGGAVAGRASVGLPAASFTEENAPNTAAVTKLAIAAGLDG